MILNGIKNILFGNEIINNDTDLIQAIEIILRLYCFQQEIEDTINIFHETNNNKLKSGYLLNKSFIENYKTYFNYDNFVNILIESKSLDNLKESNGIINYEKLDKDKNALFLIIKNIIEFNPNFFNSISEKNKKIRNNKKLKDEPCKITYKEQNGRKLPYIEEYELISEPAYKLIQKQLSFINFAYLCRYIIEKQHLFLYIIIGSEKNPFILEISKYINDNKDLKVEFIIELWENEHKSFLSYLKEEGIKDLIEYFNNNIEKGINKYIFNGKTLKYYQINKIRNENNTIIFKENENLCKISLLCYYYLYRDKKLYSNNKNFNCFEKVNLVNYKPLLDIKIHLDYKNIKEEFENNDNIKKVLENQFESYIDINKIISLLPQNNIPKYKNKKISFQNDNLNIEPNMLIKNISKNEQIFLFSDFEILDKKLLKSFFPKFEDLDKIMAECLYKDGKIILKLPNYLNQNKFVVLIGILNYDSKQFICSHILVYYKEIFQNKHIDFITKNINNYLDSIKEEYTQIELEGQSIGIMIKNNEEIIIPPPAVKERQKIGLQNIGATCYMNATLQCFAHIKEFVNFFKYNKNHLDVLNNKNTLSYSFKLLIDELCPDENDTSKKSYYAPYEFKDKISSMNPLFRGVAANDSKDLINFIVMTLHEELNASNNIQLGNQNAYQRNKDSVFEEFKNDFAQRYNSIASNLFYGANYNVIQCTQCRTQLYNYEVYFSIIFPLEEVRKFKYQSNINNNMNNIFNNNSMNSVDIYDCFEFDRRICLMSGENAMYCDICQRSADFNMFTKLAFGPNVLIIILNRGKGKEFDVKLNFGEDLNLYNYIEIKETGVNYKLIGVITHLSESGMSGNFIAFCRDSISFKWYKFYDAIVTPVVNFQKEVIDYGKNYLLFYQKIKD